jgi:hypothetical protein
MSTYSPAGDMNGGCLLGNLSREMANQSDLIHMHFEGFRIWEVAIDTALQEAVTRGELAQKAKKMEIASFILNAYERSVASRKSRTK